MDIKLDTYYCATNTNHFNGIIPNDEIFACEHNNGYGYGLYYGNSRRDFETFEELEEFLFNGGTQLKFKLEIAHELISDFEDAIKRIKEQYEIA